MAKDRVTSERHTEILNAIRDGAEKDLKKGATHHLALQGLDGWAYGRAWVTWTIDDRFRNSDGSLFGGYLAAMADRIVSMATLAALEHSDERFRTTRLETSFWRPVFGTTLKAEGRVVNKSRRLIHVEADFLTQEGKIAARSTAVQIYTKGEGAKD
ncbi:MAG: PaaI family thioesterase [Pseudomonadota bacterium]